MTQQKDKDTIPAIPTDDILKLLKDYLEMQKRAQENLKRKDLKKGGLANAINDGIYTGLKYMNDVNPLNQVDKRMDYSYNKKSVPNLKLVIANVRKHLASGGSVSKEHIDQLMQLINALEGGAGPQDWLEHDTLEDLKRELEKYLKVGMNK
jgi:hypothetical protein